MCARPPETLRKTPADPRRLFLGGVRPVLLSHGSVCRLRSRVVIKVAAHEHGRVVSHQARLAKVRSVDKAAVAIWMGIDDLRVFADDVGREPTRCRTDTKAVAAESDRD